MCIYIHCSILLYIYIYTLFYSIVYICVCVLIDTELNIVNISFPINPYYALIYLLIHAWSKCLDKHLPNYCSTSVLQKRIMTSNFDEPSSPLFKSLNILNCLILSLFILHYLCLNSTIGFCLQFTVIFLLQ